jgi:hypothetical protein
VQALRRGHVQGGELCEISGVGPVPVSVAKGLLGEAIVKLVITTGVDVANVTYLGRGPTAAQKAALLWMNPTCAVQGCYRARVEWDHREPWAQTKHTRLDELNPLCSFHHDLKPASATPSLLVAANGPSPHPATPGTRATRTEPRAAPSRRQPPAGSRRMGRRPRRDDTGAPGRHRRHHRAKPAHPEPPDKPPPR